MKETLKGLRAEVKLKKRGLAIMENHLKQAGQSALLAATRENEPPQQQSSSSDGGNRVVVVGEQQKSPRIIRLFVTGTDGISVELEVSTDALVKDVLLDVRAALPAASSSASSSSSSHHSNRSRNKCITLLFRGQVLLANMSIGSCGVKDGDSLVAVIEPAVPTSHRSMQSGSSSDNDEDAKAQRSRSRGSKAIDIEKLMAEQQKALSAFASEIRYEVTTHDDDDGDDDAE